MKKSLRLKIVLVFIFIELVMVLAIGALYSYRGTSLLEQEFIEKGKTLAEFFASTVTLPVLSGNKGLLDQQCKQMLEKPAISEVRILDKHNRVIVQCSSGQRDHTQVIATPIVITRDVPSDVEGIYDIAPKSTKEIIGMVELFISRDNIDQKIRGLQYYVVCICLAALALSVLLGALIVEKIVVHPILTLKNSVQRFSRGLLDQRVSIDTNDEIAELANSFNQMAESLKGYISEQIYKATDKVQLKNLAVLGELSAMLLHEVGNTLNRFGLIKYQLSQEQLSDKGRHAIETFDENLGSLKRFTQNVSLFSKKPEVVLRRINLKELIQALSSSLKLIDKKGVSIKTELPGDACFIMGDKELINQAVLNILTNALDAVDTGGEIIVQLEKLGDQVKIVVIDNGKGISQEELDQIFKPFFTKKGPRGTGLGLAIAKSFIEAHAGEIIVRSRPGQTQFIIYLPTRILPSQSTGT